MSSAVRTINSSTYDFIQSIATKFDQTQRPGIAAPSLILDPKKDGFVRTVETYDSITNGYHQKTEVEAARKIRHQLATKFPPEIAGAIASNADNFSQWVVILGLTDPKFGMKQVALNQSAASLLERMKIVRNSQTASDQLKTQVFEAVFSSYTEEEQLNLIDQMNRCKAVTNSYSFKLKVAIFKVQAGVANIFSNTFVVMALGVVIAWQSRKAYILARNFFDQYGRKYYIPKAVNYFINHAPLEAVRVASIFIGALEYVWKNPIKVQLACWAAVTFAGSYKTYVERLRTVVLLPIEIPKMVLSIGPWSVFFRAFKMSQIVQQQLSDMSKKGSEEFKNKVIDEGAPKAYHLWMHLLKNPENLYVK